MLLSSGKLVSFTVAASAVLAISPDAHAREETHSFTVTTESRPNGRSLDTTVTVVDKSNNSHRGSVTRKGYVLFLRLPQLPNNTSYELVGQPTVKIVDNSDPQGLSEKARGRNFPTQASIGVINFNARSKELNVGVSLSHPHYPMIEQTAKKFVIEQKVKVNTNGPARLPGAL
jgi:hypothetical protein